MKIQLKSLLLISASLLFTANTQAATEQHEGLQLMTEANCAKCHTKGYFSKKITDFPALVKRVNLCNANLNAGWFDDEVETVSDYINQTYYHFK